MRHKTGTGIVLWRTTSLFETDVDLPTAAMFCFAEVSGGRKAPDKLAFEEAEDPFLVPTILVAHGTYIIQI